MSNGDREPKPNDFNFPKDAIGATGPAEAGDDARDDQKPDDAQTQQAWTDWANSTITKHAEAIRLAFNDPEPVDAKLRDELNKAAKQFDLTFRQLWKILQQRYRASEAYVRALCEEYVTEWEDEIQAAIAREKLGEFDDEADFARPGEEEVDTPKIRVQTRKFIAAIRKQTEHDERVIKAQLLAVMRKHPKLDKVPDGPPGADDWMEPFGDFRTTKYGVFAPSVVNLSNWARVSKTSLLPYAHSSLYPSDTDPRVHFKVLSPQGKPLREISVSRAVISSQSSEGAIKALIQFNVYIPRTDFAREQIVDVLSHQPAGRRIIRVRTTGWLELEGVHHFVQPFVPPDIETISPTSRALTRQRTKSTLEVIVRLDTPIGSPNRAFGFHVSGTVEAWLHEIIEAVRGCSNIALACATAFAAPLLAFSDEMMGGFNLYHPRSSIGKTAALTIGESIYGLPAAATSAATDIERFGRKWATASDVGIIALAQLRTDVALFLDEFGSAKSIREQATQLIYTLTGGAPKIRADSRGVLRDQPGFRTLLFSTSEQPLRKFLEKFDDTQGRMKRLIDVPALLREQSALEIVPHEKLAEVCGAIYANTARLHGAIGQAWIHCLVELGEAAIRAKIKQYRDEWLVRPEIADLLRRNPQDDAVVRRFALAAASLRMATEAGLWTWSIEESDRAIAACCLRWAADQNSSVVTLEQRAAEQKLRAALLAARAGHRLIELTMQLGGRGGHSFQPIPEHAAVYDDLETFRKSGCGFIKHDGAKSRILIYHEAFQSLIDGCGLTYGALVGHLKDKCGLKVNTDEKIKSKSVAYHVLPLAFLTSEPPVTDDPSQDGRTQGA